MNNCFSKRHIPSMVVLMVALLFLSMDRAEAEDSRLSRAKNSYLSIFYPLRSTTLSTEVSGRIQEISHEMGDTFKKGDVLIILYSAYFRAEMEKAEATKNFAAAFYQSKKELFKQKSVSTLEYTKAEADYQISKANLAIARKQVAACAIRAPYDGKVVKSLSRESEFVGEGQPLLEIIDDRIIRAKFHLPASLYAGIAVGRLYNVKILHVLPEFQCKITHISPVVESNTSSFQVFAEIDNLQNTIRAGMTGYVTIQSGRDE